ncbi:MAG: type II secretion system protein [Acidobacteriota bacterium]
MRRVKSKTQNGFTLMEVLMSLAILGLVMVMISGSLNNQFKLFHFNLSKRQNINEARMAIEQIVFQYRSNPNTIFQLVNNDLLADGRVIGRNVYKYNRVDSPYVEFDIKPLGMPSHHLDGTVPVVQFNLSTGNSTTGIYPAQIYLRKH